MPVPPSVKPLVPASVELIVPPLAFTVMDGAGPLRKSVLLEIV
jgi:hypothetical protein